MKKLLSMLSIGAVALALFAGTSASAATPDTGTAVVKGSGKNTLPRVYAKAEDMTVMAGGRTVYFGAHNGCKLLGAGLGLPARHPVTLSFSEVDGANNEFIGAAKITVSNVAVQSDGWTWAWVCIEWNSPIYLNAHYVWG